MSVPGPMVSPLCARGCLGSSSLVESSVNVHIRRPRPPGERGRGSSLNPADAFPRYPSGCSEVSESFGGERVGPRGERDDEGRGFLEACYYSRLESLSIQSSFIPRSYAGTCAQRTALRIRGINTSTQAIQSKHCAGLIFTNWLKGRSNIEETSLSPLSAG